MSNEISGKSGTLTESEFNALMAASERYGTALLTNKVAKICSNLSIKLLHENSGSAVGNAYKSIATRISGEFGSVKSVVSREVFTMLEGLVTAYGAEVVVWKLAKIASRRAKELSGETAAKALTQAKSLKLLFPKAS